MNTHVEFAALFELPVAERLLRAHLKDTPDDLVHELFTQHFWEGHPLGRPILGSKETVESFTAESLLAYFHGAYVGRNMIISAAGILIETAAVCGIHEFLGLTPIKPEIHQIANQNSIKAPPFDKEAREKLKAFYRPWNEKLYALLDRDMGWG